MCSVAVESTFQFTSPALKHIEFGINDGFAVQSGQETHVQTKLNISVRRDEVLPEAEVELSFEMGEKGNDCPYYVHAVEGARFRWSDDMDAGTLDLLLNQNAPALLLSYLRPIVVQITGASSYGAYNIPFMNFTRN